ncbi:MAG: NTP transferase domain-containing protein [bacterium]|nr:NTP transferase domain-containing protein [bacterium]
MVNALNNIGIVILAAGKGKRMGATAQSPKVLMPITGKPILARLIEGIRGSLIASPPIIVIAPDLYIIRETIGPSCEYAIQESPLGTGHAVLSAQVKLSKYEHVLVLYGDHPLVTSKTIDPLVVAHLKTGADMTLATVRVPNFEGNFAPLDEFGRIIRDEKGVLVKSIERKDATEVEREITEVNPCFYMFKASWLWSALPKVKRNNAQREYYLTDLLEMALQEGRKVVEVQISDFEEAIGVNTQEQLALAEWIISKRLDKTARFHTQSLPI